MMRCAIPASERPPDGGPHTNFPLMCVNIIGTVAFVPHAEFRIVTGRVHHAEARNSFAKYAVPTCKAKIIFIFNEAVNKYLDGIRVDVTHHFRRNYG